jgi:hypothetical protein
MHLIAWTVLPILIYIIIFHCSNQINRMRNTIRVLFSKTNHAPHCMDGAARFDPYHDGSCRIYL